MSRVSAIPTRNLALDPLRRLALGRHLQAVVYVCMFVFPFGILPSKSVSGLSLSSQQKLTMSDSMIITIDVPLTTAPPGFYKYSKDWDRSAIIAIGFSLVLKRFLDVKSYVYEKVIEHSQNHGKACFVEFNPESSIREALSAIRLDECSDDQSDETTIYQAFLGEAIDHHDTKKMNYAIELEVIGQSQVAVLHFNANLYTDFQARNMARAFSQALLITTSSNLNDLSLHLSEVNLLSQEDHAIVKSWNTVPPAASEFNIPDLVERMCAQYPDQIAVTSSSEGSSLTYAQLSTLANRLALYLIKKHGLGRGIIVPTCFDKSTLAVVAMLAIFKTGAAYCCLDPQHPSERHQFILDSVKAPLVLTSPQHQGLFSCSVLVIDSTFAQGLQEEDEAQRTKFDQKRPDDTCIVVFSSGSTGVPKGIVHTHRTLATGLVQNGPRHGLDRPGIRVFQWCAYTFDISLTEIWGPLICGGVVCIPSEEERLNDVETPMNLMEAEWAFFTPSFARFFCRQRHWVQTLKTLVVGGEALTQQDARAFLEGMGLERVIHLFGPAELITQFLKTVTPQSYNAHSCTEKFQVANVPFVPSNAHCWIVDPENTDRLAPVGAVGELLIEGPALFTGYLNDAARNGIALIRPPRWRSEMDDGHSANRIYRSGDLVRYVESGEIQYVSRQDGVVKLRGQFVDLGEIESVLRTILGSQDLIMAGQFETEAAVLLVKDVPVPGDQALVTFLCPKDPDTLPQDRVLALLALAPALQSLLRKKLPEYMLPRLFYAVDKFPYNASGKLDRKALTLFSSKLTLSDLIQLPSHPSQSTEGLSSLAKDLTPSRAGSTVHDNHKYQEIASSLNKAWNDVFGPSADDAREEREFFHHGGNSMRAMELVAAARRHGVSISVAKIFGNPVFDSLVAVANMCVKRNDSVEETVETSPFSLIGSIERKKVILREAMDQCRDLEMSEVQDAIPATPLQAEFMAEGLAYPGSNKAQTWFTVPPEVPFERFQALWEGLIGTFVNLRCRMVHSPEHGDFLVVFKTKHPQSWIRIIDGTSKDEYLMQDRAVPMGYGEPLVRCAFMNGREQGDKIVVLTMHQCIYDGYTVRRIEVALNDLVNGKADVPATAPSFIPFIKHVVQLDEKESKYFWRNYLEGFGTNKQNKLFPTLPSPSYCPKADSLFATNIHFPAMDLTIRGSKHITLPTVVLAAWALLVNHHTGDDDIVFPLDISGRGLPVQGIMEMPFPTIARLPVRIQLPSDLLSLVSHTTESVSRSTTTPTGLERFLHDLQDKQIQLATTALGHAGCAKIATYSDSCRRAVDTCNNYPLGSANIQYAISTWHPKSQNEQATENADGAPKQLKLEFQVDRNDAKYFSPGDALTLGCYILSDQMARFFVVYDSQVVREEEVAEYISKTEVFMQALITSLA